MAARSGRQRRSLREKAAFRELAVLADGPWAPRWYWRDELEAMQEASRRMGHPDDHAAAELRGYRPTEEFEPHPTDSGVSGRVWRFRTASERMERDVDRGAA
jgi:hypothetical protein